MKDVGITVMKMCCHQDLIDLYENPIEHACDMKIGQKFVSKDGQRPDGMCTEAWNVMEKYVLALSCGGKDFFDGWMKDPRSAMISCNDGFRPVSFYIEVIG